MRLGLWEQFFLIFALSMDGFAASLCMGMSLPSRAQSHAAAVMVTAFHALFFAAGHTLGHFCAPVAAAVPWVSGAILTALGAHLLLAQQKAAGEDEAVFDLRHAAALAFSTAADAMTAGFSFALAQVAPLRPLLLVTAVMGSLALLGSWAGRRLGARFRRTARLAGGMLLFALGVKNLAALL